MAKVTRKQMYAAARSIYCKMAQYFVDNGFEEQYAHNEAFWSAYIYISDCIGN